MTSTPGPESAEKTAARRARLARLASLIDRLEAVPAADRPRWLADLPAADADLQAHLAEHLQVLQARTDGGGTELRDTFLQAAQRDAQVALLRSLDRSAPEPGLRLGPWRLIAAIGRGGMGEVWLAERADGAFVRQVALKLPLASLGRAGLAERFVRERDILATLVHPGIARLYDAGVADSGQPYLVMELVEGWPITRHADSAGLGLQARVDLMVQVLHAVQHAHAHLVVHRDLKPSNIHVDRQGRVHLLDFGIARLLDNVDASSVPPADQTEAGSAALTPTYAAPEQIERAPVSTAADVYSLGVVLYELLAGTSPYRPAQPGRPALEDAILHSDPVPPSRALGEPAAASRGASLAALRQQLRGDLDAIVLKALAKTPAQRYASADALNQDLARWRNGLPVLARPPSLRHRLRKFVGRNRVASLAIGGAVVALATGAGLALWQADQARQQAAEARAQAAHARQEATRAAATQDFLISIFDAADPARAQGRDPSVRELMARAEQNLPIRLSSQPELGSALRGALVDIYLKLDDEKHAVPLAEARVAELRTRTPQPKPELGLALYKLGLARAGAGRHGAALAAYSEAEPLLAASSGAMASDAALDLPARIAHTLSWLRRLPEARTRMQQALPALIARHGAQSWEVLNHQASLLVMLARLGEHDAAGAILRQIEPQLQQPTPEHALEVAHLQAQIGHALWVDGQWAAAERMLDRSLAETDRLVGPRNTNSIETLKSRAGLLDSLGRLREADTDLARLAALAHSFYGEADAQTAIAETFRVTILAKLGQGARAEAHARAALRIAETAEDLQPAARWGMQRRLGLAMLAQGRASDAATLLTQVVQGEAQRPVAMSLVYLAAAHLAVGHSAAADQSAAQAVAVARAQALGPRDRLILAKALLSAALVGSAHGQTAAFERDLHEARDILQQLLPADCIEQTWPDLVRAQALRDRHRHADADALDGSARRRWASTGAALPARLRFVH